MLGIKVINFHCSGIWQSGNLAIRQSGNPAVVSGTCYLCVKNILLPMSRNIHGLPDCLRKNTLYNNLKFLRWLLASCFTVICCFLCFPHFVLAQDSALTNSARATAYRRADRLCYAATYYGDMSANFDQMIHQFNFRQAYMDDVILQEGIAEWIFIDRHSLYSALTDLSFTGGDERKRTFSNTVYVDSLINERDFEDAIKRCAERKGLVFEDLLENMRSTISRVDNMSNWFGRGVQLLAFETAATWVVPRVIRGVRTLNSWIFTPQVRSWLSQTGLVRILSNRLAFFQERKKAVVLSVVGVPVISTTTMGDISFYHQIYQENQASIENVMAHVTGESIEEWKDRVMSPIDVLWMNRWVNIEEDQGEYWDMIDMAREIDLDHLDNETSLPRDLAIRIDLYFVDYWFVVRRLNYLRATRGEYDSDTLELNIVKEWFDFRRRQLESQTAQDSPERAVALELLSLSRDYEFLCDFDNLDNLSEDIRSSLLCKIHFFYTMRSHNGGLSPRRADQLQQMEIKLESL